MAKRIDQLPLVVLGDGDRIPIYDSSTNSVAVINPSDIVTSQVLTNVVSKSANYTIISDDNSTVFSNNGQTIDLIFTLPAVNTGVEYGFLVEVNGKFITVRGQTINLSDNTTTTEIKSSIKGSKLVLFGGLDGYYIHSMSGTWEVV